MWSAHPGPTQPPVSEDLDWEKDIPLNDMEHSGLCQGCPQGFLATIKFPGNKLQRQWFRRQEQTGYCYIRSKFVNVSIIIPAFNAAGTIRETLDSVLAQTHPAWEAVVVDDGSTDTTGKIARNYAKKDPRIRVIRQANGGEAAARNTGVEAARYEWLAFLDSDDWVSVDYLECMTAELAAHPELDAVHCGSVRVASDGTFVKDDYEPPTGDLFPTLARRAAFPVHACIVRKSLVDEVGRFDVSLETSADWDLWQRIARTGARFGAVREVLAYYRMLPNSASLGAEQLFRDGLRVLRRGHGPDLRVPRPHPDYVNGWREQTVASQEFYLLCWSAGLLIGSGKDARHLLASVNNEHYAELHAPAIAQCLFESATLPTCQTREAWEGLWSRIHRLAEQFLIGLEAQSKTPDLARQALPELKKMILRHSATWGSVIAKDEATIAKQKELIQELEQTRTRFEQERGSLHSFVSKLEQEKATLEIGRERLQQLAEERAQQLTTLREALQGWQRKVEEIREQLLASQDSFSRVMEERDAVESERNQWRAWAEDLAREKTAVEEERVAWKAQAREHEAAGARIERQPWTRLGLRLGALQKQFSASSVDGDGAVRLINGADRTEGGWQLRTAQGNSARFTISTDRPRMICVAIVALATKTAWDVQLNYPCLQVKANHRYALRFWARSEKRRSFGVGFAKAQEPWSSLGLYEKLKLKPGWRSFELEFIATEDEDDARVHFDLGGRAVAVEISSVSLQSLSDRVFIQPGHGQVASG